SERKNVLSTLFVWLTIGFYGRHARLGGRRWYGLALLCFGLGLTAKPMLVSVPFLLLVLEIWPFDRVRGSWTNLGRLAIEKIPFFVLAALVSVVTFELAQGENAVESWAVLPVSLRLANAVTAYAAYLWKVVWPAGFTIYYPYELRIPTWE